MVSAPGQHGPGGARDQSCCTAPPLHGGVTQRGISNDLSELLDAERRLLMAHLLRGRRGPTAAGHSAPAGLVDLIDNLEPPDAACFVC